VNFKDELLAKGIDEKTAGNIIALLESGSSSDAMTKLRKALNGEKQESLFKAEDDDEDDNLEDADGGDDDDDDYDAEYMKKNMRRYMSENQKACKKMMEDMGGKVEKLNKAVGDIDTSADGAIVAMEDLTPALSAIANSVEALTKAVFRLNDKVDEFQANQHETHELLEKASNVTLMMAEEQEKTYSQSTGRKGLSTIPAETMQKAVTPASDSGVKMVYSTLAKAIGNGDRKAGMIMSVFESSGKKIAALSAEEREYVKNLMEAK
jgi:hypothetical protein